MNKYEEVANEIESELYRTDCSIDESRDYIRKLLLKAFPPPKEDEEIVARAEIESKIMANLADPTAALINILHGNINTSLWDDRIRNEERDRWNELINAGIVAVKHAIRCDLLPEGRRELLDQWLLDCTIAILADSHSIEQTGNMEKGDIPGTTFNVLDNSITPNNPDGGGRC
jgi:hypothetical protein